MWAVLRGATPPLALPPPLPLLRGLKQYLLACSQPASSRAVVAPEYDRCPESIDVQNPWIISALERPEPSTVDDCLHLEGKEPRGEHGGRRGRSPGFPER